MSSFCLSHSFVYLLYYLNKQGCGLTRKGHGNGLNEVDLVNIVDGHKTLFQNIYEL